MDPVNFDYDLLNRGELFKIDDQKVENNKGKDKKGSDKKGKGKREKSKTKPPNVVEPL